MKDFNAFVAQNAGEVTWLMEDEELSAWRDKNLSDDSLDEGADGGDELQRGGVDVLTKSHCPGPEWHISSRLYSRDIPFWSGALDLQYIHNFPLC